MSAVKLRAVLIGLIVLLTFGIVGGTWELHQLLLDQARETDHAKIDADLSQLELDKLKKLQADLAAKKDLIERTKQITTTANQYHYQDQVVSDINAYAYRNGLTISSFDFGASAKANPAGAAKTAFTLSLQNPVKYDQFLAFIHQIESNVTHMQITTIALSPDTRNPTQILNPTIGLEVFLKK